MGLGSNVVYMEINGKALGVTFYCPTNDDFVKVAKIREALDADGIATMWTTKDYHGRKITALDVYENANIVAGYLSAMSK